MTATKILVIDPTLFTEYPYSYHARTILQIYDQLYDYTAVEPYRIGLDTREVLRKAYQNALQFLGEQNFAQGLISEILQNSDLSKGSHFSGFVEPVPCVRPPSEIIDLLKGQHIPEINQVLLEMVCSSPNVTVVLPVLKSNTESTI